MLSGCKGRAEAEKVLSFAFTVIEVERWYWTSLKKSNCIGNEGSFPSVYTPIQCLSFSLMWCKSLESEGDWRNWERKSFMFDIATPDALLLRILLKAVLILFSFSMLRKSNNNTPLTNVLQSQLCTRHGRRGHSLVNGFRPLLFVDHTANLSRSPFNALHHLFDTIRHHRMLRSTARLVWLQKFFRSPSIKYVAQTPQRDPPGICPCMKADKLHLWRVTWGAVNNKKSNDTQGVFTSVLG